jgi:hypothetical protein
MHPLTFLFSLDPSACAEVFCFTLLLFCAQAPSDAPVLLCIPLLLSLSSGSAGLLEMFLCCWFAPASWLLCVLLCSPFDLSFSWMMGGD